MADKKQRNQVSYSFSKFKGDIDILAQKIWKGKYQHILAISKWWLIPAYFLAKKLGINTVKTICLSSYEKKKQWSLIHHTVEGFKEEIINPKNWLIVDDIVDSWKTLQFVRTLFGKKMACATLFVRPRSPKPEYFIKESNDWIRFFYED